MHLKALDRGRLPQLKLYDPDWDTKGNEQTCVPPEQLDSRLGHRSGPGHKVSERLTPELLRVVELARCLPGEERYQRLMNLARRVSGLPEKPDQRTLRLMLDAWNTSSGHPATGRWKARLWSDFRRYLKGVRVPLGTTIRDAVRMARVRKAPAWTARYAYKPELVLMVKLCAKLSEISTGGVFPLSVRTAAEAVVTSRTDAARMLDQLRGDGVLEMVEKGKQGSRSRVASTWRYRGRPSQTEAGEE